MQLTELKHACEQYYGLQQPAFGLTPDTDFYVELPAQKVAFDTLLFALSSGEGFIKISGEVGTGKTLLCRRLLNTLEQLQVPTAYIPNPDLSQRALWRMMARELGINDADLADSQVLGRVQQALLNVAVQGKTLVLVIDEAQCMPPQTLEALRLISNLETERQKLVQIVLFGQPELNHILARPEFRQLLQRITYSAELTALNGREALAVYLQQRLSVAGYRGMPLFRPAALKALWRASGGIPRLVNILATKTLLAGYGSGSRELDYRHVMRAVADTEGACKQGQVSIAWHWLTIAGAMLLVVL